MASAAARVAAKRRGDADTSRNTRSSEQTFGSLGLGGEGGGSEPQSLSREASAILRENSSGSLLDDEPEEPRDEYGLLYNKSTDENAYTSPLVKRYCRFARQCSRFTVAEADREAYFGPFIILIIILAGILVGIQTYDGMEDNKTVNGIDFFVLAVFIVECLLKIAAEGMAPWMFWLGSDWTWNNFDFIVVVLCIPGVVDGGGGVAVLRLMRLARLIKLVKKIPQLQMIVMGLIGGLKSITYIVLLLFLIFYLFAIGGIMMFRENDPVHFRSVDIALLTLFRASTLEDWTDVMYINIYGCKNFDSGFYENVEYKSWDQVTADPKAAGGYWTNTTQAWVKTDECDCSNQEFGCLQTDHVYGDPLSEPVPWRVRKDAGEFGYGVDAVSHPGGIEDDYVLGCSATDLRRTFWCRAPEPNPAGAAAYWIGFIVISALVMLSLFIGAVTMAMGEEMESMKSEQLRAAQKRREKAKASGLIVGADAQEDFLSAAATVDMKRHMSEFLPIDQRPPPPPEDTNALSRAYTKVARFSAWLVEHHVFVNIITLVICAAGITVGIGTIPLQRTGEDRGVGYVPAMGGGEYTDEKAAETYQTQSERQTGLTRTDLDMLFYIDQFILYMFILELLLKLFAEDKKPWRVLIPNWNKFDIVVVAGSLIPGVGSMAMLLRLLRLLRVLKLVKALPQLAVIVNALVMGLNSIGYIGVILFMFYYLFAILGMMLFKENDPWHFGLLHTAMLSLFRASTMEDWTDIMYVNMYGCDAYETGLYKDNCPAQEWGVLAVVYWVIFAVIGGLVLLTLFIGVVCTAMDEAKEQQQKEEEIEQAVAKMIEEGTFSKEEVVKFRMAFGMLDKDHDGSLKADEIKLAMKLVNIHVTDTQMENIFAIMDEDGSGEVDIAEFLNFLLELRKLVKVPALAPQPPAGAGSAKVTPAAAAAAPAAAAPAPAAAAAAEPAPVVEHHGAPPPPIIAQASAGEKSNEVSAAAPTDAAAEAAAPPAKPAAAAASTSGGGDEPEIVELTYAGVKMTRLVDHISFNDDAETAAAAEAARHHHHVGPIASRQAGKGAKAGMSAGMSPELINPDQSGPSRKSKKLAVGPLNFDRDITFYEKYMPFQKNDSFDPYVVASVFLAGKHVAQNNTEWIDECEGDCTWSHQHHNSFLLPLPAGWRDGLGVAAATNEAAKDELELAVYDHDYGTLDDYCGAVKISLAALVGTEAAETKVVEFRNIQGFVGGDLVFQIEAGDAGLTLTLLEGHDLANPDSITNMGEGAAIARLLPYAGLAMLGYFVVGLLYFTMSAEEWSFLDTIYFSVATFTTVGFGDVAPKTQSGRLFTCLYALFGISMISVAAGYVVGYLAIKSKQSQADMMKMMAGDDEEEDEKPISENEAEVFDMVKHGEKEDRRKMRNALLTLLLLLAIGATGLCVLESGRQDLTIIDGLYWACITSATVGYGDVKALTNGGKIFSIFYIFLGVIAMGQCLSLPTDILLGRMKRKTMDKVLHAKMDKALFEKMDKDKSGEITRDEFLGEMLINMGLVDEFQIERILKQFDDLDADESGELTWDDFVIAKQKRTEDALNAARAAELVQ